jgi:hypothetical protein
MAEERHGMCELTRHDMAGERQEDDMGTAWAQQGMCELALVSTLDGGEGLTPHPGLFDLGNNT